jgi:glycosyltransferase involved in cell wall biosynthesis
MYPIARPNKAAAVRIRALLDEFEKLMPGRVDHVCGTISERRRAFREFWREGRDREVDRVYVESHSTSASEADLLALRRLRRAGKRIVTYVRDAYPLYDSLDMYPGVRSLVYKVAFRISYGAYDRYSDRLGVPSRGLADALGVDAARALLLPPGMQDVDVAAPAHDGAFLLVGGSAGAANGVDIYVDAARARPDTSFIWCAQPRYLDALASWDLPANFRTVSWDRAEIIRNLDRVKAFVLPRQVTPYMDLAVPIKLMDYLSWSRPIVSTRCAETTRILGETGSGIPVDDTAQGLLRGIDTVNAMTVEQLSRYRELTHQAAQSYSWEALARRVLAALARGGKAEVRSGESD